MTAKSIKDKFLYIAIFVFGAYLIARLIDRASMLSFFPLDFDNDISSYMAHLFFLKQCGFYNICDYWYNGAFLFHNITPGWFLFTFPIYILVNSVTISTYISTILILIMSFLAINFIGIKKDYSIAKRIFIFLVLFANPITIGSFIRLGRVVEMTGLFTLIILFLVLVYYFDKKLNLKFFIFFSLSYFLVLIASPQFAVLSQIIVLSFLLIKTFKEKVKIILSALIGVVLSSFWSIDFLRSKFFGSLKNYPHLGKNQLLTFTKDQLFNNLALILIPLIFIIVFYFYYKSNREVKKRIIFYIPILLLSILLLLRIIAFIPILNDVFLDPYLEFILFFTLILFFDTNINVYNTSLVRLFKISLIILPMILVAFSVFYTPWTRSYTQVEYDTISLLKMVDDRFIVYGDFYPTSYPAALYSYAPIYLNKSTALGWATVPREKSYFDTVYLARDSLNNLDCLNFNKATSILNTTNFIGYGNYCSILGQCGLKKIADKNNVCLYRK